MKVKRYKSMFLVLLSVALIATLAMVSGCKGKDGDAGTSGRDATQPVYGAPSAAENLQASITSVDMSTGTPVVTFSLLDEKGAPIDPRSVLTAGGRCRFYIAQIDSTGYYKNYFLNSSGLPSYDTASSPSVATAATSTFFSTTATPGVYKYTFSKNIAAESGYSAANTHTIVAQISRSITSSKGVTFAQAVNPYYNFRPDGNAVTVTREVVSISSCNECHGSLGLHGGSRRDIALCVVCHYPGVNDPESGQSVDLKSMIHKIHMGSKLPSHVKGADYEIAGTDFSGVVYPYRTGDSFSNNTPYDCTKCHKLGTDAKGNAYGADVDKWKTNPTREKCNTCHDTTTYDGSTTITVITGAALTTSLTATPHLGGTQSDDALCAVCHSDAAGADYQSNSVPGSHLNPIDSSLNTGLTFSIISVTAISGSTVTVQFAVKDSTGATTTMVGGTSAGADACTVAFGYMTGKDYDNTAAAWRQVSASGSAESYIRAKTKTVSSTSVNPATMYDAASSSYIVSVGTITVPAGAGTGVISIYGSKLVIVPTLADKNLHRSASQHITKAFVPAAFYYFNMVTGAQVTSASSIRRDVVSTAKCNACHTQINIHSRNDTQLCAMCHAPNLYVIAKTTGSGQYPSASGNLKDMIHGIHGAATTTIFYGVNPVTEEMPQSPRNCTICHISASTAGLPLPTGVANSMTTGSTNTALDSAATASLPTRAACMTCHTSAAAASHAVLNTSGTTETCEVCHASGRSMENAHAPLQ